MRELPPIIGSEKAAGLLSCSTKTVEERLRTGDLPGEKFGEPWVIPTAAFIQRVNEIAVEKMLERRKPKPARAVTVSDTAGRRRRLPSLPGVST